MDDLDAHADECNIYEGEPCNCTIGQDRVRRNICLACNKVIEDPDDIVPDHDGDLFHRDCFEEFPLGGEWGYLDDEDEEDDDDD